jgi:hypothetical protein
MRERLRGEYPQIQDMVGMWIHGVVVDMEKEHLIFDLIGDHKADLTAYGDCCSESWIEHITIPPGIEDGVVILGVLESDGVVDPLADGEHVQVYQTSFTTEKGEIIVEYRNSSNGYYGGSLDGPKFT